MQPTRFAKALALVALLNGVLFLCVRESALAADKEAEAKKYAEELKTSKDAKVKVRALEELGKFGQLQKSLVKDALPAIYKALEDKDGDVRAAAAYCLGLCDEPSEKAVPLLVKMAKDDKDEGAKIGALKGLAAMGPNAKEALPDIRAIAKAEDKKSKVGKAATNAAKAIGTKN